MYIQDYCLDKSEYRHDPILADLGWAAVVSPHGENIPAPAPWHYQVYQSILQRWPDGRCWALQYHNCVLCHNSRRTALQMKMMLWIKTLLLSLHYPHVLPRERSLYQFASWHGPISCAGGYERWSSPHPSMSCSWYQLEGLHTEQVQIGCDQTSPQVSGLGVWKSSHRFA